MTTQKVAFLIAGQIRDEHLSFPKTKEIAESLDAEVFISAWKARGTRTLSGARNYFQLERVFGDTVPLAFPFKVRKFLDFIFPRLETALREGIAELSHEELARTFPGAKVVLHDSSNFALNFGARYMDGNSLKMLFHYWVGNEQKTKI